MKTNKIIDFRELPPSTGRAQHTNKFSITYIRHDGVQWEHLFPYEFFSWRCAEYGVEPGDFDTLIDILLHEQHIDFGPHDPNFLYNTDQETARLNHLAKVKASKKEISYTDPDGHLGKLRLFHLENYDHRSTEAKRVQVESVRMHRMRVLDQENAA